MKIFLDDHGDDIADAYTDAVESNSVRKSDLAVQDYFEFHHSEMKSGDANL